MTTGALAEGAVTVVDRAGRRTEGVVVGASGGTRAGSPVVSCTRTELGSEVATGAAPGIRVSVVRATVVGAAGPAAGLLVAGGVVVADLVPLVVGVVAGRVVVDGAAVAGGVVTTVAGRVVVDRAVVAGGAAVVGGVALMAGATAGVAAVVGGAVIGVAVVGGAVAGTVVDGVVAGRVVVVGGGTVVGGTVVDCTEVVVMGAAVVAGEVGTADVVGWVVGVVRGGPTSGAVLGGGSPPWAEAGRPAPDPAATARARTAARAATGSFSEIVSNGPSTVHGAVRSEPVRTIEADFVVAKPSKRSSMRTAIWLHMLLVVVAVAGAGCATRSEAGPLEVEGELAGRILASGTAESPIELRPQEVTELSLELRNTSDRPVTVAHVRIEGELLDLIFLTYDTGVHQTIQPGDEGRMAFKIDFFDLQGQAHGLLRGQVRLYGENREPLGAVPVVLDGRGGRWATTVTFNLVLLGVATASFAWNLYRLSQRRLPGHRFARGLRFLHSGAAAGLTVSAASSTLRLWPLGTTGWVSITVVMTLFAFGLGYLSVGSDDDADDRAEDGPLGDPDGRPDGGGVIDLTAQEPVAVVPVAPPELPAPAVRLEGEPAAPGA